MAVSRIYQRLRRLPRLSRWLRAMLMPALFSLAASGQVTTNFHTLTVTGPSSNRLCVVFLAEGYTGSQTNEFLTACTNALQTMFGDGDAESDKGEQPFVEYSNYFNAYAVFVASAESGSDRPSKQPTPQFRNTFFNSIYDFEPIVSQPAVITIPTNSTGQGKVDGLLNLYTPTNSYRYRLPVLLVNEPRQGGSGGTTLVISTHFYEFQGILTHEAAHVLAGLGDEYDSNPGAFDFSGLAPEPNTTTNTAFNQIPWKAWINTNTTPVPTPNDNQYFDSVGLFEGAHYSQTNWYRPKLNCRMRSVSTSPPIPFCEVCREALVKTFYSKIRPWDTVSPTNPTVVLAPGQEAAFSVSPLQPSAHALSVQWRTNGVDVSGATNASFQVLAQAGLNSVSVIVRDATNWVRNDPAGVMSATYTWALSSLWLESAQALPGNQFRFTVRGAGVTNFTLKASTNLAQWTSISTNDLSGGQFNFTNSGLSGIPWRFYRAVSPPQ